MILTTSDYKFTNNYKLDLKIEVDLQIELFFDREVAAVRGGRVVDHEGRGLQDIDHEPRSCWETHLFTCS